MEDKRDFTSVEVLEDGDLVLVGEKHYNKNSKQLVEEIVEEVQPNTVALEADKTQERTTGGMGAANLWARENGINTYKIDKPFHTPRRAINGSYSGYLRVANEFPYPLQENGDVDRRGPMEVRSNYRDKYGREAYEAMYTRREEAMARRLNTALEEMETPILAVTGVYHTQALAKLVPVLSRFVQLDRGRIVEREKSLRTETERVVIDA